MNIFHDGQSFHPSSLGISFPDPVCFGIMRNRFSFSFECSVLWCSLFLYCTWNLWVIDMFQIILLLFQVICSLLCHLHPQKICLRKKWDYYCCFVNQYFSACIIVLLCFIYFFLCGMLLSTWVKKEQPQLHDIVYKFGAYHLLDSCRSMFCCFFSCCTKYETLML